ncbi:hypothetical protein BU17DRAFT_38635 [Hysterangium stoloniferum]|nr:hypothetical protein BU17DRAFT_38635 [Hysterangium stoloniferum]
MSLKLSPLDWLSFPPTSPGDVHAPHPDLFELELDSSIIALPQGDQEQLQLLNIELSDPYAFVRSDTPRCGPPSTFTVSSESTYDSYSSHSESLYNFSEFETANTDYHVDLGIDFSKFSVDVDAAAAEAKVKLSAAVKDEPDANINSLPKLANDTNGNDLFSLTYVSPTDATRRSSFHDDLTPAALAAAVAAHNLVPACQAHTATNNMGNSPTPSNNSAASSSRQHEQLTEANDSRKKYKCPSCPRAFARAYNLKTHQQTHDPNRLKPHICPHRSCGRSFSRKHDLGRHLVSIHRDESIVIGVSQGARSWCDDCGAGWIGKQPNCECADVK